MTNKVLVCFKRLCPKHGGGVNALEIANIFRALNIVEKEMCENLLKEMFIKGIISLGKSGIGDCLLLTEKGRYLSNLSPKSPSAEAVAGDNTKQPTLSGINETGLNYGAG